MGNSAGVEAELPLLFGCRIRLRCSTLRQKCVAAVQLRDKCNYFVGIELRPNVVADRVESQG